MNTPSSLLGVLFDHTIGNILRMLAVIRLPKLERGRVSRGFVATLIVIMGYGLVMLFSASYSSGYANYGDVYHFIRPQSIIAVAGLGVMWLVSNINYRALRYMNESFYIITLVLLVAALFSPVDTNGTYRWVYFAGGAFSLQPSELAKFSVMLWTADMLDRDNDKKKSLWYGLLKPALPLVPILVLLKMEPHNSAMMLLCLIFVTMIACNGSAMRWWPLAGAGTVAGAIAYVKHLASGEGYAAGRLGGVWGLTPRTRRVCSGRPDRASMLSAPEDCSVWASATASRNTNGCPTRRTTSSLPSSGRNWASSGDCPDCPVCGAGHPGNLHCAACARFVRYAAGPRYCVPGGVAGFSAHRRRYGVAAQHGYQFAVLLLRRYQFVAAAG